MEHGRETSPPPWFLDDICALDVVSPGLAGTVLRGSTFRRHVVAAALAARRHVYKPRTGRSVEMATDADLAHLIISARLPALIEDAFGCCPSGYLGVLRSMSAQRISQHSLYARLHQLFSDPALSDAAAAIHRLKDHREALIDIAIRSPRWLLRTGILPAIHNIAQLDDLLAAVALIKEINPSATQQAIEASLRGAASHRDLRRVVDHFLSGAAFPDPGLDFWRCPAISTLQDASELSRLAREWRICANTYRLQILAGVNVLLRFATPAEEVVALLRRNNPTAAWEFVDAYGFANRRPSFGASEFVEDSLRALGVIIPNDGRELPPRFAAIDRLTSPFLDLDDWLPEPQY